MVDRVKMKVTDFSKIERAWQRKWEDSKIFSAKDGSKKKKYYLLEMYPYPSGSGLHMGHALNYTIGDIKARLKRMQGFNVLYPMGYDSFGLPAENAAIKAKSHPKKFTEKAIKNYIKQQKALGLSYDWSRKIASHDPSFYKWDQWIFLKLFEKGLAYRKEAPVNWCEKCNTVLANEQVVDGKCWIHHETNVKLKQLAQWFLKITDYADELYENLNTSKLAGWPKLIKNMQKNWIGKSQGVEVDFEVNGKNWKVFTTRPDTLFGVTFLVVSAQCSDLEKLVTLENKSSVENFLKKLKSTKEEDIYSLEKEGVFTGSYGVHPLTGEKIPIWTGNFVISDYGSGMIMAVPAHDRRDFEFAKKYNLPINRVISDNSSEKIDSLDRVYTGFGRLVNSSGFNGLKSIEAQEHITKALEMKDLGRKKTAYRLKDWLISRQRFWGCPIPMIYCDNCGIVPVSESNLPVRLPSNIKFTKVENPLKEYKRFVEVKCVRCGKGGARRETDTMDTFVDSSWYFLRYCDPKNIKKIFDSKKTFYWMPIDQYVGGKEHATGHLIYFRFFTKFLRDIGLLKIDEPVLNLFNQGILHASDGKKMSKSLGNVVLPETVSKKYGMDSARLFLVSVASPDKDIYWDENGIEGASRFVLKVLDFVDNFKNRKGVLTKLQKSRLNRTIRDYTSDLEEFRYNLAVIKLRNLFGVLEKGCDKESLKIFLKLMSVICPHVAEEMWKKIGGKGFVSISRWPVFDSKKIDDRLEEQENQFEKVVSDIKNILKIVKGDKKKVYLYVLPNEFKLYNSDRLEGRINCEVVVFSVSDKKKYDPEGKSRRVKPGRPGIYIE